MPSSKALAPNPPPNIARIVISKMSLQGQITELMRLSLNISFSVACMKRLHRHLRFHQGVAIAWYPKQSMSQKVFLHQAGNEIQTGFVIPKASTLDIFDLPILCAGA